MNGGLQESWRISLRKQLKKGGVCSKINSENFYFLILQTFSILLELTSLDFFDKLRVKPC